MNKMINPQQAIKISKQLRTNGKSIVLAGGFFDILHVGHIKFLESAKKAGDFLFVLLEDDKKAREVKGIDRPINSQSKRSIILSALQSVDYVVKLYRMTNNKDYDKIINQIEPNVIAATYPDPNIEHKIRQAKLVNGKVEYVIKRISDISTTKLEKLIGK